MNPIRVLIVSVALVGSAYGQTFDVASIRESGPADGRIGLRSTVEATPGGLTVLADSAVTVDDVDRSVLAGQIKDLEEDVADAKEGAARDRIAHKLDQLKAVQAALGH